MTRTSSVSLASLDMRKASETPFKMPLLDAEGGETGVVLHVLGAHSEAVTAATNRLLNERRRKEAIRAAQTRPGKQAEFEPVESDIEFGQRLAAVRLVGWQGIAEEFSPELALQLCQINPDAASQILEASGALGNFTKASSKAS